MTGQFLSHRRDHRSTLRYPQWRHNTPTGPSCMRRLWSSRLPGTSLWEYSETRPFVTTPRPSSSGHGPRCFDFQGLAFSAAMVCSVRSIVSSVTTPCALRYWATMATSELNTCRTTWFLFRLSSARSSEASKGPALRQSATLATRADGDSEITVTSL